MSYDDRPRDLEQDTKNFLKSEYGMHLIETLREMQEGHLSNAADMTAKYPERHAAKYSAIKDVLNLIYSPIGNDTPSHG